MPPLLCCCCVEMDVSSLHIFWVFKVCQGHRNEERVINDDTLILFELFY